MAPRRLPDSVARKIAVAAGVHPNTVQRLVRGGPVRLLTYDRIAPALRQHGLGDLVPDISLVPAAPKKRRAAR